MGPARDRGGAAFQDENSMDRRPGPAGPLESLVHRITVSNMAAILYLLPVVIDTGTYITSLLSLFYRFPHVHVDHFLEPLRVVL